MAVDGVADDLAYGVTANLPNPYWMRSTFTHGPAAYGRLPSRRQGPPCRGPRISRRGRYAAGTMEGNHAARRRTPFALPDARTCGFGPLDLLG